MRGQKIKLIHTFSNSKSHEINEKALFFSELYHQINSNSSKNIQFQFSKNIFMINNVSNQLELRI